VSRIILPPSAPSRRSLRSRIKSGSRAVYVWATPAKGVPLLEESAWQRGKRQASELANGRAILFMIVCGPIFGVVGVNVTASQSWFIRSLLGALAGLIGAVIAALAVAGAFAALAPRKQRKEAREYAKALEAHVQDYAQWARRREIAYDFRHDTLMDVRRLSSEVEGGPLLMGSVADEEARWRATLTQIGAQMTQNGADASAFMASQLGFLDNTDGAFEGDDIARIRNSMLSACQNLLSEIARKDRQRFRLLRQQAGAMSEQRPLRCERMTLDLPSPAPRERQPPVT
jgi:hypothetical protein